MNAASDLERKTAWAKREGVKESKTRGKGLAFLNKKIPHDYHDLSFPAADHVSYWNKNGKPFCIVSQPYQISSGEMHSAANLCEKYGLQFSIVTWPAWHYPNAVLFMEWRKRSR